MGDSGTCPLSLSGREGCSSAPAYGDDAAVDGTSAKEGWNRQQTPGVIGRRVAHNTSTTFSKNLLEERYVPLGDSCSVPQEGADVLPHDWCCAGKLDAKLFRTTPRREGHRKSSLSSKHPICTTTLIRLLASSVPRKGEKGRPWLSQRPRENSFHDDGRPPGRFRPTSSIKRRLLTSTLTQIPGLTFISRSRSLRAFRASSALSTFMSSRLNSSDCFIFGSCFKFQASTAFASTSWGLKNITAGEKHASRSLF